MRSCSLNYSSANEILLARRYMERSNIWNEIFLRSYFLYTTDPTSAHIENFNITTTIDSLFTSEYTISIRTCNLHHEKIIYHVVECSQIKVM